MDLPVGRDYTHRGGQERSGDIVPAFSTSRALPGSSLLSRGRLRRRSTSGSPGRLPAETCLDPATGQVLWKSEQSSGTLAASETALILRLVDGTVKSLAPARGTVRWEAASGIVGDLPPALDGDRVFIAGKGMAALDIATGRVVWSAPADPTVTAPPVAAGSRLLAGEEDGTL